MKNLKIYKSALALLTATSILLLCGCNSSKKDNKNDSCRHLTVYFEDSPVTFKECEGYEIGEVYSYGRLLYEVKKENQTFLSGGTNQFNIYKVNHDTCDELINEESVQKTK